MSFKNFIYTEDDKDLTFLPKNFSLGFNIGSPSMSINTEPVRTNEEPAVEPMTEPATEPANERVRTIVDLGGSPKGDTFVVHAGSVAARIKERKCKIMGDDTPVLSISDDDEGLEDCLELKDATSCHLKISSITPAAWKGFLDNHLDVDLLDLHDRCYARQVVADNAVNRRSRKLLEVIEKLRGKADVIRARECRRTSLFEMDELPCSTQYFEANNLPRCEFIVALLLEFIEIDVVVKLLSLSLSM
nr:hypothetical protein [Tanacetum cinerariifolium]